MIINLHLYTKLGHPVYGQGRAIFEKEESHRHEGDEKRGKKGGVTKRSVTEVIRVVQVARTKGPFYYRVPLSSHGRFENSSVSRVAIIFSLLFPLPSSIQESLLIYVVLHLTGPPPLTVSPAQGSAWPPETAWFHA